MLLSFCLIYAGMEIYVEFAVDDGMQYDLEMWRYSRKVKRISSDPKIGHEHRPNAHARLMGADVRTNADGLRDVDIPLEKPPGVVRIVMLGDSLTFGWGVPIENTYTKRVETLLRKDGLPVDVINTGVGNYNTSMEVEYFLERGVKYRPDIVVLNYFINDAEPMPSYETNVFSRNLRAYVYFASRLDAAFRLASLGEHADWRHYYGALYDEKQNGEGLRAVQSATARLAEYCRSNGIRLLLVNYPELRQPKDYPFPFVESYVEKLAKENGIEYFSLLSSVRDKVPEKLWITAPDPHPSSEAHAIFAEALAPRLDAATRAVIRARTGRASANH